MNPFAAFAADRTLSPGLLAALTLAAAAHHPNSLVHLLLSFGIIGVTLVSIVDSSFIPLPVPGITDILLIVLAAQHANLILLVGGASLGSFLGGYFSYKVGQSGGLVFLKKHVPARIFQPVCRWMEAHPILSVAVPAILPPPMPLSPFVLAAGAVEMSQRKFMTTFTISRVLRHGIAAWLGIRYGRGVLHIWRMFSDRWGMPLLIGIWSAILICVGITFWRLYKTSRSVHPGGKRKLQPPARA